MPKGDSVNCYSNNSNIILVIVKLVLIILLILFLPSIQQHGIMLGEKWH